MRQNLLRPELGGVVSGDSGQQEESHRSGGSKQNPVPRMSEGSGSRGSSLQTKDNGGHGDQESVT